MKTKNELVKATPMIQQPDEDQEELKPQVRRIMGVCELAEKIGLNRITIYKRVKLGIFPPELLYSNGKKMGWTEEYVNAWFEMIEKDSLKKEAERLGLPFEQAA